MYYQSEILSSPHRITAYESAQPIQIFMLQTTTTMAIFADVGNEDLEAILENKDSKNTKSSIKASANILTSYCASNDMLLLCSIIFCRLLYLCIRQLGSVNKSVV